GLVHGALEGLGAGGKHAVDALGIVAAVGRHEGHAVAGLHLQEGRLEDHDAGGSAIQHLDLVVRGEGGNGREAGGQGGGGRQGEDFSHVGNSRFVVRAAGAARGGS